MKDPASFPLIINARAESAPEKPSFRAAMKRRRCLFVADAYYEWRREPGHGRARASRPYLFRHADATPLALAGLYETWIGSDGSELDTACILTVSANGATVAIHDRMPAILAPKDFDLWLSLDEYARRGGLAPARRRRPTTRSNFSRSARTSIRRPMTGPGFNSRAPICSPERGERRSAEARGRKTPWRLAGG